MSKLSNFLLNLSIIPQTFLRVKNWNKLFFDYLGLVKKDYIASVRKGPKVHIRHSTTDKGILKEIFILREYGFADNTIRKSNLIIDIGAQIGMFSLYASNLNKKAKIISFEPMDENYRLLEKNIKLNSPNRIQASSYGISGKTERIKLYLSPDNSGGHSLYKKSDKFETISVISVNEMFRNFKINHCSLIKMDCEGAEYDIMQNISDANLKKIGAMILEYHSPERLNELVQRLKKSGFKIKLSKKYDVLFATR